MSSECMICRGRREIELPLYRLDMTAPIGPPNAIEPHSKRFPCPECQEYVAVTRVQAVNAVKDFGDEVPEEVLQYVQMRAAHLIVDHLISQGFIKIEQRKDCGKIYIRATLGAVP